MEAILNELELGILKETFEAERVQPEVMASLSDGNLASLGVSTIGDRIRLRDLCTKSLGKSKNESDDEMDVQVRVYRDDSLHFSRSLRVIVHDRDGLG